MNEFKDVKHKYFNIKLVGCPPQKDEKDQSNSENSTKRPIIATLIASYLQFGALLMFRRSSSGDKYSLYIKLKLFFKYFFPVVVDQAETLAWMMLCHGLLKKFCAY